jgi:hypothetical protein
MQRGNNRRGNPPRQKNRPSDQQTPTNIQNTSGHQREGPKDHNYLRHIRKGLYWLGFPIIGPVKWFGGLAPIEKFTAVLCIIGGIQTWTFIQRERAFATISAIQVVGGLLQGKQITLLIEVKNSGRSTAFIEALNTTVLFAKDGVKLPLAPPYGQGQDVSSGPVLANDIVKVRATLNVVLSGDQVKTINDGSHKMYVIGFVSFVDDFSAFGTRVNGYCVLYNPNSGDAASSFDDCGNRAYTYSR